jgi:hypothetical protein
MITGLIETEEDLNQLIAKIKRANSKAGPDSRFEEFTIMRRMPGTPPPLIQFIHGVMPEGYNPLTDKWKQESRPRRPTTAKANKQRKKRKKRAVL